MNLNLKFWTWPRQMEELRTLEEFHDQVSAVTEQNRELRKLTEMLRQERNAVYARTPAIVTEAQQKRANLERLLVLAGMANDNPLWNVVLSYADEHARNESQAALAPNLSGDDRQYNTGRAAGAADFAAALRDLRVRAEIEARKQRGE